VRLARAASGSLAAVALLLGTAAPASAVLGLGVSTPTVSMNLTPGSTATGSGAVVVTPGLGTWHLSLADASGNNGHLAHGAVGCTGSQAQTTNQLSATASGVLLGTHSTGAVTVSSAGQEIVNGTLGDTVTVAFSLVLPDTERMLAGCVYSTTLTYTVQ
jgi:hypothetical protein